MNARTLTLGCLALLWSAATAAGDELIGMSESVLTLRSHATVSGPARLADVIDFSQADPRLLAALGEAPAPLDVPLDAGATRARVSREAVLSALQEARVNMARVLLVGGLFCEIEIDAPAAAPSEAYAALAASAVLDQTLAGVLRGALESQLRSLGGTLEIEFDRASREALALTTPPYEFRVAPWPASLGLNEMRVELVREGRVQRSVTVTARVKLLKKALVAAKPINQGTVIRRDALDYSTRVFVDEAPSGLNNPELVVGQEAKRYIAAGEPVRAIDLKVSEMVKRSRPVTVVGNGRVGLKLTGIALDSGSLGDSVRVRIGDSRKERREVRGVVSGIATVQLSEGV